MQIFQKSIGNLIVLRKKLLELIKPQDPTLAEQISQMLSNYISCIFIIYVPIITKTQIGNILYIKLFKLPK